MTRSPVLVAAALLVTLAPAAPARAARLRDVLERTRPDSLVAPLRAIETHSGDAGEAADAAYALGQLHYARGEYRQAADAFSRAAARAEPARKGEARYWAGLAWLGAHELAQARATLEEVARADAPRRGLARLGIALTWEAEQQPARAMDELEGLLAESPGEAAPAALAQLETLALRLHKDDVARRARERLLREWPSSLEAVRMRSALAAEAPTPAPTAGATRVQVGAFASEPRARALAGLARREGFAGAQVTERREGATVTWIVTVGDFPSADEARKAGERASEKLGVAYRLVKP